VGKKRSWQRITTIHSFKDLKIVRVFGIVRVSTDKQAKKIGESLDHQKEVLANWVKSKSSLHAPQKWQLVDVFVENEDGSGNRKGRSATKREGRLGLKKALDLARAALVDVVVVTKLDRIARNVGDYVDISAEFNESQVALVCLDLDIDTSTPDGQMIMRNHANLAQWQAERIAQYSLETAKRHVEQGRPLGPPPIGYKVIKDSNGKGTFIPDPPYRKHVDFIEKQYIRIKSIDQLVVALHKKGYKSRKGKTYTKMQVSRILRNIRYLGKQGHDSKIYQGNWPAIRTEDRHEAIQRILKANTQSRHSPNRLHMVYPYFFHSKIKCGRCNSGMLAQPSRGRSGKYYPYYVCIKALKTKGIDCETLYLPADAIDNAVLEFIRNLRLKPKVIEDVIKKANKSTASRIGELENDLRRIQEKLKDIRTKISNLVDVLAEKGVSRLGTIKSKLENLEMEEEELASEEARVKEEISIENQQAGMAHDQIQPLNLFNDFFEMNKDNPKRIKELVPRFVNYVIVHVAEKKKGIGRLDIGLFGKPFVDGPNAEVWNEALNELGEHLIKANGKQSISNQNAVGKIKRGKKDRFQEFEAVLNNTCGNGGPRLPAEYQMGSAYRPF